MLAKIDAWGHRVWDDRHTLENTAHVIGGIGVGLLIYASVRRSARTLGWALVGLSSLLHLYAYLTSRPGAQVAGTRAHEATTSRSGPTFGWALVHRSPQ